METFLAEWHHGSTLNMFLVGGMILLSMGGHALMSFALLILDGHVQESMREKHGLLIPLHPHENHLTNAESNLHEQKKII